MTLAEFASENDIPTRRGAGNSAIALAELKSRRVPVEWFEAVAIVQEVCGALLGSRVDADKTSLGPKAVFIDPAGGVRIAPNAGEKGELALRQIGELLRTSLAESAFPVPLRLVITQACSTPPFYASIAELSGALEYFERPGRTSLIRSVYERAEGYQPVAGAVAQETPEPEAEKPARPNKRQPRHIPKTAIGASAAAAALIVLLLVVSQLPTRQQGNGPVADIVSSVGELVDRVNPFTASSSSEAPSPAIDSPKAIDAPPRRHSAKAGGRAPRSSAQAALPVALAETPRAADVSLGEALRTSDTTDTKATEPLATGKDGDAVTESMIYCANDQDVTPPVAAYPRLPAEPPTRLAAEGLSTLELLVDETGQVESVKLRGQPRHLGEALLVTVNLSAAKTWRFVPAVKDGRPVKYRKLVQVWPTTP